MLGNRRIAFVFNCIEVALACSQTSLNLPRYVFFHLAQSPLPEPMEQAKISCAWLGKFIVLGNL